MHETIIALLWVWFVVMVLAVCATVAFSDGGEITQRGCAMWLAAVLLWPLFLVVFILVHLVYGIYLWGKELAGK